MNKIFKVIYSKTKHCYVVVSELAKSHCKSTVCPGKSKTALTAAVLLALGTFSVASLLMPMTVEAATKTRTDGSNYVGVERTDGLTEENDFKNYGGKGANGADSITLGLNAQAGAGTITIGDRNSGASLGSVYIGQGDVASPKVDRGGWATSVGYNSDATGYGSIALGSNAVAKNSYDKDSKGNSLVYNQTYVENGETKVRLVSKPDIQRASVAIGYGASADNGNIAIGSYSDASTDLRADTSDAAKSYLTTKTADSYVSVGKSDALRRISNVADGAADTDVATIAQVKKAVEATDASKKANIDASNIGSKLQYKADGTTAAEDSDKKANENLWGAAIGTGSVADSTATDAADNGSQQLVTGGTVYSALQKQKTELTDALSVKAGWGINKTDDNTISVKHNLSTGNSAYADTDATGLILGGSITERNAAKKYGAATASSVIVGAQNALASNDNSVVIGGLDNVASGANSTVVGGDNNNATASQSAVFGGRDNTASGIASTASAGIMNVANGQQSTAIGGFSNYALGIGSTSVGGYGKDYETGHNSSVNGSYSVGIAGGSTGTEADYSLAAGRQAVVTTENGTAIGYQATTDEANTIAFGHDAGDVSGYTVTWQQKATEKDGKYYDANNNEITETQYKALINADHTYNDYTKTPTVKENTYDSAAYNRLAKVADGKDAHDVVVMEQLTPYTKSNATNIGVNLKTYTVGDDGETITEADASDEAKTANENAWGAALGTGKIADSNAADKSTNGSQQLVTGGTVYSALQQQAEDLTVNAGWGINIKDETTQNADGTETTTKNVISLNRNLGTNLDTTGHVYLDVSETGLVLGTVVNGADGTDTDLHYGATGDYAVTVGGGVNTASGFASTVLGGSGNTASSEAAVVSGGAFNVASGSMSAVYGGSYNEASGGDSAIFAGMQNKATKNWATVGGGAVNEANGTYSSIWGGYMNKATDNFASIYGGMGNSAYGPYSAILGGGKNKAGQAAVVSGGLSNEAVGAASAVVGGESNIVTGANATALGGVKGSVNGTASVGILGGSTGKDAIFTLAAGYQSTVTNTGVKSTPISEEEAEEITFGKGLDSGILVGNGDIDNPSYKIVDNFATAIGYKATADEAQTVAFGHDKGDTYYGTTTYTWKQKATVKDGHYYDEYGYEIDEDSYKSLMNADGTWNDYSQPIATVEEKKYDSAYYNRLVKVADGIDDHDVVVMEQLKQYAEKDASNLGNNIKVYKTDANGNVQLGDDKKPIEDQDATTTAQKANKDAWGKALGADTFNPGTDKAPTDASTSDQLVTGKTLYNYDKPTGTPNYVSANNTTGQNLSALDAQVKANADELDKPNHNIKFYSVDDKILKYLPKVGTYSNNEANDGAKGMGSMAAGVFTHSDGIASTVAGSYSGVLNQDSAGINDLRGAAALSYGTFNVNQNTDATETHSGVANSIIGQVNMTKDSNAAIIYGAGNIITDSYRPIDETKAAAILGSVNDPAQLGEAMKDAVESSGGQVMVMGGGNSVDKAYMTQVVGVGNKVTGSGDAYDKDKSSQLNYVEGFYTTLTNGKNDYIIGSHNTVTGTSTETNQSNIVFGDNHTLTNTKNNVILGSLDAVDETTVSDVVSIGHNAKVTKEGGVAIGSGSEATTAAGVAGYDPTGATADTTAAWTSKKAAVSVGTADETRQITGVAAGKEETDAVNVAQLKKLNGMKANVNADNIGKNLNHKADGTAVTEEDKTANENAWGATIGTGSIAADNGQLVTGKTVYEYNKPVAAEGKTLNYISDTKTTGQNLTALDTQIKTNADNIGTNTTNISNNTENITNLKNLSNITEAGQTVIKNLAKNTVKVEAGDRVTVTNSTDNTTGAITYTVSANNNGTVAAGDSNLVSGDTVNTAITNAINNAGTTTDTKLAGKANVDASNIGKNLNHKADGTAVTDEDKTANENAWGSAIGTGKIEADNGQLVTGKTVYEYNKPVAAEGKTLNYISDTKTTGQNLTALDTQIKTNADNIGTNTTNISNNTENITNLKNLSNITEAGQTVIKNLAKGSIGMEDGSHTSVSHRDVNGVETYKVDVTVDGQVAENNTGIVNGGTVYSALQDIKNQTSADLANKVNVDASNIGANLKGTDGKTAASDAEKTTNENAWGTAIGTGSITADNGQLVTGKTVYEYNKPVAAEGKTLNYISDTKTTGQNLTALDTQIKTNADNIGTNTTNISNNTENITNLKNLSNITEAGQTVIKNLAKGSIGMEDGSHTSVSHRDVNGVETYKVDVTVDGQVAENNTGIVNGGTVYSALQDIKNQTSADLANKANVDASNLTPNNVTKWQEKLGNGQVVSGNTGLVTGDTVFQAVDTKANRDGSNLTADEANKFSEKIAVGKVEANDKHAVSGETVSKAISDLTGDMNTKLDGKANTSLDNITKDGQTVIKKLSQDAVQVKAGDDHITVDAKTDETTGNKTYTISAKDGKVASGDTGLISGGTLYNEVHVDKDGSYIKSGNTVGNNLSALDTGLKNTSSLIHTNTSGDTIHIGETSKATKVDVSSTDANGNKNGRVVTGVVTDAKDANSAANVGYVNGVTAANTQQIYREMNNAYGNLNRNINRAAAGSNALAALYPLDYDPADKASFAVGYGHYRNANAAAIGAFYYPNANTMVNVGVSVGNGDPGFNAGVSFKLGKGSAYNGVSKAEMAQTIHDQAEEISAIKANDAAKDKRIDALEKENQEMKKQIQEILARLNG